MMMKSATSTFAAALCLFALADAGGLRPKEARKLESASNLKEVYFSEFLAEDESVVILEDGPFKFTVSCKTHTRSYWSSWYSSSYEETSGNFSSSSSFSSSNNSSSSSSWNPTSSSSRYWPYSSGGGSSWCDNPCGSSSSYNSSSSSGGGSSTSSSSSWGTSAYSPSSYFTMSDDGSYTESIAALDLTFTASEADFVYGSPTYAGYPGDTPIVGGYEAGEQRTQTLFAGRDGGWGDVSTMQSLSGHYMTINGDSTIGLHKEWSQWLPGGNSSFPEGVECMLAGIITYLAFEED